MQISPPFGYTEVVPFLKTHKVRMLAPGQVPEFVQKGNAVPISHVEFQPVARHYPIVFTSADTGKTFTAVAVLGLTTGENLYYMNGKWIGGAYVPAYARRFPFCMAKVSVNRIEQKDRLICVEKSWLDDAGEALFDASGEPSEKWKSVERLLSEYEVDLERVREMSAVLSDYGLLEPFNMRATLKKEKGGGKLEMAGMYRVNEKNLETLNAAQLKNLMRKGFLARIYLHLISLENFARLLDRKARQSPAPT